MAGSGGGAAGVAVQPAAAAGAGAGRSSTSSAAGGGVGGGGGGGGTVADPRAEALRCPRCDSANTKFCYYNNYSLSQPRHFCKACKRYWTRGGTLRNVPVGGGCRKNKRSRSANNGGARPGGSCAVAAAAAGASSNAAAGGITSSASLHQPGSLSSALGLHAHGGSSSLASLLLGSGGSAGDHLGLFHAMQSVVSDATAYEMQQQHHQTQVDQLLGLGYGANGAQIQMKPWQHHFQDGAAGLFDGFYAPLLSGSIVPGLEELHVKAEATAGDQHNHQEKKPADGDQSWDQQHTTSSSNVEANIMASDALMAAAAAASMNPAVSNANTAPTSSSLMYWGNGGIAGSPAPWPDMANCGSSIATFF